MHLFSLAWYGLGAVLALMLAVWVLSLCLRDASSVDRYWGLGFVLLVWVYALASESRGALAMLLVALARGNRAFAAFLGIPDRRRWGRRAGGLKFCPQRPKHSPCPP